MIDRFHYFEWYWPRAFDMGKYLYAQPDSRAVENMFVIYIIYMSLKIEISLGTRSGIDEV